MIFGGGHKSSVEVFRLEEMMIDVYLFEEVIQTEIHTLTLLLVMSAALNVALTRGPLPAPSTITMIGFLQISLSASPLG